MKNPYEPKIALIDANGNPITYAKKYSTVDKLEQLQYNARYGFVESGAPTYLGTNSTTNLSPALSLIKKGESFQQALMDLKTLLVKYNASDATEAEKLNVNLGLAKELFGNYLDNMSSTRISYADFATDPATILNNLMTQIRNWHEGKSRLGGILLSIADVIGKISSNTSTTTQSLLANNQGLSLLDLFDYYGSVDNQFANSQTDPLKQFITTDNSTASLTTSFLNNNEALTGYLAMNDVPQLYSATLNSSTLYDPTTGSWNFQTQGTGDAHGNKVHVGTFNNSVINGIYSDLEFESSTNPQGIYMYTNAQEQGLAVSNSLIGSKLFNDSANIKDFGEFAFTYNLYTIGGEYWGNTRVNDHQSNGAVMVFEFCSNITTDPTTGQTTGMSDCVDMQVQTPNADLYNNTLSSSLPANPAFTYTVTDPQALNTGNGATSIASAAQNSQRWSNSYLSTYTTRTIPVADIVSALQAKSYSTSTIKLNKVYMETLDSNEPALLSLSNMQLTTRTAQSDRLYKKTRLQIFQTPISDSQMTGLLGTDLNTTGNIQTILDSKANDQICLQVGVTINGYTCTTTNSNAVNWLATDRANDIYTDIGQRDIRGYAFGVFNVVQECTTTTQAMIDLNETCTQVTANSIAYNIILDSTSSPVTKQMFLGSIKENVVTPTSQENASPLVSNDMANNIDNAVGTPPDYPLVLIYYDEIYMRAKDKNGKSLNMSAIRSMIQELITRLTAFGVSTKIVDADQLATYMKNQDSSVVTNSRIVLTGPLPSTLFKLQANNVDGVFDSWTTMYNSLTTQNLLRQYITNGGHVIYLQGQEENYVSYLVNSTIQKGNAQIEVVTPTLGNFNLTDQLKYYNGANVVTVDNATQGQATIGLGSILGMSNMNNQLQPTLFASTDKIMTYANSSNVNPTVSNYPSTGLDPLICGDTSRVVYTITQNTSDGTCDAVLLVSSDYPTSVDFASAGKSGTGTFTSMYSLATYNATELGLINDFNAMTMADNVYTFMTGEIIANGNQTVNITNPTPSSQDNSQKVLTFFFQILFQFRFLLFLEFYVEK